MQPGESLKLPFIELDREVEKEAGAELKVRGARFVNSSMFFLRDEKTFANTDGSLIVQTIYRTQPSMTVTAVSANMSDFQARQSTDVQPMARGYEHVTASRLIENAPRSTMEALAAWTVDADDVLTF